jgi:hypothetical protein
MVVSAALITFKDGAPFSLKEWEDQSGSKARSGLAAMANYNRLVQIGRQETRVRMRRENEVRHARTAPGTGRGRSLRGGACDRNPA